MKKFLTFILIFLLVIQTFVLLGLGFDWYQKKLDLDRWNKLKFEKLNFLENYNTNPDAKEIDEIRSVEKKQKDVDEVKIIGWMPDWDYKDSFESVKKFKDTFDTVSPFWFEVTADGRLKKNEFTDDPELINFTKDNNITLMPAITGFDAQIISDMLNNEENMNRHITEIVSQTVNNNYDGIDLDYESIYLKDNDKFFEFLQQLSIELTQNDKSLSFTALPKWGEDDVIYLAFPETRKNFDYKKIADLVDEFRIMTYEFSPKTGKYYGPVGPIGWLEDVVRYAIYAGVPRDKIVLGVHTYSFDYPLREKLPEVNYYPVLSQEFNSDLPGALAYYNVTIEKIMSERNVNVEFEDEWGEALGFYTTDEGQERVLVFPNQKSIDLRKELAADYGIRGVAYWRIGDEGELNY